MYIYIITVFPEPFTLKKKGRYFVIKIYSSFNPLGHYT
jgi:hypothetical protein